VSVSVPVPVSVSVPVPVSVSVPVLLKMMRMPLSVQMPPSLQMPPSVRMLLRLPVLVVWFHGQCSAENASSPESLWLILWRVWRRAGSVFSQPLIGYQHLAALP
jgi:hypothetical protein